MTEISTGLQEKLEQLPELPGIYKMLDSRGDIIYIGKSKCLRKRVKSYFSTNHKWSKIKKLVFLIHDIDYVVTDTHLEARFLECDLIKEIKPYFNSQMKNDSEYVYLKVEGYNRFNALSVVTEREEYCYGPFRQRYSLYDVIHALKHIFPIIKKGESYVTEYHIIHASMDRKTFEENRGTFIEVFSNDKSMKKLMDALRIKMEAAASLMKYETASKYRDIIQVLEYINNTIWRYQETMSQDIFLRIPIKRGYKFFYISDGNIVLMKYYENPTNKDFDLFIENASSMNKSITMDSRDEKAAMDYRDILYSEINSLPKDMVKYYNQPIKL